MRNRSLALIPLLTLASHCGESGPRLQAEFPFIAATPFPTQHGDLRRSDYDLPAPSRS